MEEAIIDSRKEFTEACTSIYNHIQSLPEEEQREAIQKMHLTNPPSDNGGKVEVTTPLLQCITRGLDGGGGL